MRKNRKWETSSLIFEHDCLDFKEEQNRLWVLLFRILVDRRFVKYLTIDPGLYDVGDLCFEPSFIDLLPALPGGDWNTGHISLDAQNNRPHFSKVSKNELPGIKNIWHPLQIDHLELQMGKTLNSNVFEVTCPRFNSTVLAKFARFDWEIPQLNAETAAYQSIEGHEIGPRFLGHLTEERRVIGFIMERIDDARHATPGDLSLCQLTLSKLLKLGIRHDDINKHKFLIHGGKAVLIDFECATRGQDATTLDDEFQKLQEELSDTSGRGGRTVEVYTG